jgi:hypothetical protein
MVGRMYVISLLVFLTYCGSVDRKASGKLNWVDGYVTEEVQGYQQQFANMTGRSLTVPIVIVKEFTDMDVLYTVGVCYSLHNKGQRIELKESAWQRFNALQQEALVLHELVHCELRYFTHDNHKYDDGCPTSIMNAHVITPECFSKHRLAYYQRISSGVYNQSSLSLAGEACIH